MHRVYRRRFPLYAVAVVGTLVGVLVYTLVSDPGQVVEEPAASEEEEEEEEDGGGWSWGTLRAVVEETKECMRIPTFWVIVCQVRCALTFLLPRGGRENPSVLPTHRLPPHGCVTAVCVCVLFF